MTAPSNCVKHIQSSDGEVVKSEVKELERRTWNLEQGESFQVTLVSRESDLDTNIIFGHHHIVMDGVSWHLFLRDLGLAYQMIPLKLVQVVCGFFAGPNQLCPKR